MVGLAALCLLLSASLGASELEEHFDPGELDPGEIGCDLLVEERETGGFLGEVLKCGAEGAPSLRHFIGQK